MTLSIVIICWNDRDFILPCIESIYAETDGLDFEIIVSDNGSTDGSIKSIRERYPDVRVIENGVNLGFGGGNNAGFKAAKGAYVLILNPDTIIKHGALPKLVDFANQHPEAAAFGCRVLNPDGSLQISVHPLPTLSTFLIGACWVRWLGRLSDRFLSDYYFGWNGLTERPIGYQGGCCLLVRGQLLKELGGFDTRFFHQLEDADLCRRVWDSGKSVLFFAGAEIIHIGGQTRGNYPVGVLLETERSKYRYLHKYYGIKGAVRFRVISLIGFSLRYAGYQLLHWVRRGYQEQLRHYRVLLKWHWHLNPAAFIEDGREPDVGHQPLSSEPALLKQSTQSSSTACAGRNRWLRREESAVPAEDHR
jgi:GT2 family glycosyltransferase